jgi:hypothetical protein
MPTTSAPAIGLSEQEQKACDDTVALVMDQVAGYLIPGATENVRLFIGANVEHLAQKIKRYARHSAH